MKEKREGMYIEISGSRKNPVSRSGRTIVSYSRCKGGEILCQKRKVFREKGKRSGIGAEEGKRGAARTGEWHRGRIYTL